MGNVSWDGMRWDRHKLLEDGNGTDKYVPWTTLEISSRALVKTQNNEKTRKQGKLHELNVFCSYFDKILYLFHSFRTLQISLEISMLTKTNIFLVLNFFRAITLYATVAVILGIFFVV